MKKTLIEKLVIATIALVVVGIVATPLIGIFNQESVTFTVEDKERIVEKKGENVSSKYLVFTDRETFENTDSIFFLKFNSSDLYGQLKEGETYTAKVAGIRVPAMSMYRNIISIERDVER